MLYAAASIVCGFTLPRLEHTFGAANACGISVASAQAVFSSVASGVIALTGIVFSIALVVVQFSSIAYSPRLGLLFARDPMLFHSLGALIATFFDLLATLLWVDRNGSGMSTLKPMFDWRQLQMWKISESALPTGSEIRFRPPSQLAA